MKTVVKEKYAENEYIELWVEDGIVISKYKPGLKVMSLEIAQKIVRLRHSVTQGEPYPAILDLHNLMQIQTDARKFYATPYSTQDIAICAIIVRSPIARLLVKLFLSVKQKEPVPTRIFGSFDKAKAWIWPYRRVDG